MQEGYNIDLLEDDRGRSGARSNSATPPPASAVALSTDHSKAEAGGYAGSARNGYTPAMASAPPKPWYKTRKWLIIMFVGAIVVIAAVVGGAVGGTAGHKNTAAATPPVGSSGAGGGGGEAATKTTVSSPAATTSSNSGGGGGGGGGGVGNIVSQASQGTEAHAQPTSASSVANAAAGAGAM